jgi:hypothetical protein
MSRKSHLPSEGNLQLPLKGNNIDLVIVISPDNQYQTGKHFTDLVLEINQQKERIRSLTVISADYLARHYDRKKEQITSINKSPWYEANRAALEQLDFPREYVHIISWFEIVQSQDYKQLHKMVRAKFANDLDDNKATEECANRPITEGVDLQYRTRVLSLANEFTHKGTLKQCVRYLLDETAGMLTLKGTLIYPGKLNQVLHYAMANFRQGLEPLSFCPYKVSNRTSKKLKKPNRHGQSTPMLPIFCFSPLNDNDKKAEQPSLDDNTHRLLLAALLMRVKTMSFPDELSQVYFLNLFDKFCDEFNDINSTNEADVSRYETKDSLRLSS